MKKFLLASLLLISINFYSKGQCPPGASAFESIYPLCPAGCGVLLKDWPEGVVVNIFGGTPYHLITSGLIPGTYGGPGVGDAFVCVPCNIQLTFASAIPGATNGCVINTGGIIPVKLKSFTAAGSSRGTCTLKWSTANELGSTKFIIERSTDGGNNFSAVATLTGGTQGSTERSYTYADAAPGQGTIYYRVKTVEITGNVSYSAIVLVKNQAGFGLSIYPNPAVKNFSITVPAQYLPAAVNIYDVTGKSVFTQQINQSTLTVSKDLANGIYAVRVTGKNNVVLTQKLVKK